jgi:curved DNA-binding protein
MSARDALEVLGLESVTDPAGLRGAYLTAVKRAHPDRPGGDAERLRRVIEAYETLRDRRAPEPEIEFTNAASPTRQPPKPTSRRLEITTLEAVFGGVRAVPMRGCGDVHVRLPPGLRDGDLIAVTGVAMTVAIASDDRAAFVGDNLCLRVRVERAFLTTGGELETPTPAGPLRVQVSRQDAARGLVRVDAARLPTQGRHRPVHLVIKLEAAPSAAYETRTRTLLRRFTAAWAA